MVWRLEGKFLLTIPSRRCEVVEMGLAEDLIKDSLSPFTTESVNPDKIKDGVAIYVADAE